MTDSYPGWATQRAFQLDGAMVTALAESLPAPSRAPGVSRRMVHPSGPHARRSTDPEHTPRVSQPCHPASPPPNSPSKPTRDRAQSPLHCRDPERRRRSHTSSPPPTGRTVSATWRRQLFCRFSASSLPTQAASPRSPKADHGAQSQKRFERVSHSEAPGKRSNSRSSSTR